MRLSLFAHRRPRRAARLSATAALTAAAVVGSALTATAAAPVEYVAGAPAVDALPSATLGDPTAYYDGESVDFEVSGAVAGETLSLRRDSQASTAKGELTIVGNSVYVGNGTAAEAVGMVDGVYDGANGKKLRVNFISPFQNPSFEESLTGWSTYQSRVDLGVTSLAGVQTVDNSSYNVAAGQCSANPPNQDNNVPSSLGAYSATVSNAQQSAGASSLQLVSSGITTAKGYDVVHGPAAWSDEFPGVAGDTLYFDWRAFGGGDAYHVYGYLLKSDGTQTKVLSAAGNSASATTNWATASVQVPSTGNYRFVFVAGTYDCTGGKVAGASLYIDNVRVFGKKVDGTAIAQLTQAVTYSRTAASLGTSEATRTVTVTAKPQGGAAVSTSGTVHVLYPPVPPVLTAPSAFTLTNAHEGADTYPVVTGTFTATDRNDDAIAYGVQGAIPSPLTLDSVTYTHAVAGAYGVLHVDATTGKWAFIADAAAVDAVVLTRANAEVFTITATAGVDTVTAAMPLHINVPAGAPGAPSITAISTSNGLADLTWTAPTWTGGSALTAYLVEWSVDGGATWSSTRVTDTSARITGLANEVEHTFRVRAENATAHLGAPSAEVVGTPVPIVPQGAPTISAVASLDGGLDVTVVAPTADGGSPIIRHEYSLDGGETWIPAAIEAPIAIRDLPNGVEASILVRSVNKVGAGPASDVATGTPLGAPRVPTTTVAPLAHGVDVSWTAPSDDGGSAITGYEYSVDGGEWLPVPTESTSFALTGLTPGTPVDVSIRAINTAFEQVGPGAASAPESAVPFTTPDAPAITRVEAGNGRLIVEVAKPAHDGWNALTHYEYSLDGGRNWIARADLATSFTITGLTNDTAYPLAVRAANAAGGGTSSATSVAVPKRVASFTDNTSLTDADELTPGHATLRVNGNEGTLDVSRQGHSLVLADGDTSATITALQSDGTTDGLDANGHLVLNSDGAVRVTGEGFVPGSIVDVWVFSTPTFVGSVQVLADGTFAATLPLPAGLALGQHTLQLDGVGADGNARTVSTGIVLKAPPANLMEEAAEVLGSQLGALATTGSNGVTLLGGLAALVLASGLGLMLVRRRAADEA